MDDQAASESTITTGLNARVELNVTDADTAQTVGSGDVPVLATPRVVALVEAATVAATATRLPTGMTTVGIRVDLEHRAATPVGRTVVARAKLSKIDGRRLVFEVSVSEGTVVVAEGRVERVLVDRQRFLARAFDSPAGAGSAPGPTSATPGPAARATAGTPAATPGPTSATPGPAAGATAGTAGATPGPAGTGPGAPAGATPEPS